MRKLRLLTLVALAMTGSVFAADRHQSYFTFDDGGTIVRSEDGREIEARVNLPLFPGDEVITSRRGRAEVRLADGNVIAIDRASAVRFRSIRDSYEGEATSETVVQLRYGHIAVQRTESARDYVRLDTENASYVARDEAIYAIDTDRGRDRVSIFDGVVEVRTPERTIRLRAGEEAKVDDRGIYDTVSASRLAADDFERWFLGRSERHGRGSSRYLDRSLAYAEYDLSSHGTWVYVSGFGSWVWRPYVSVGWRPYHYGHWIHGPSGALVWVSYEPWGWVPYHYGRWAYDPFYGWVWLPGYGYSPAWVYWMYGPGYIGWAPAGWWDAYRPYYNWCYRPYVNTPGFRIGFGFYGRIRVNDLDLRPWTFVHPDTIVSTRVDRAALTTDAIRDRLARGGGLATVSGSPARFTREDLRNPAAAVNVVYRRGVGGGTGKDNSGSTDLTPFFRRDPEVPTSVRERIIRTRGGDGDVPPAVAASPAGGSDRFGRGETPGTSGGVIRRGGASEPSERSGGISRGTVEQPEAGGIIRRGGDSGSVSRGATPRSEQPGGWREGGVFRRGGEIPGPDPEGNDRRDDPGRTPAPSWRGRVVRPDPSGGSEPQQEPEAARSRSDESWRGRGRVVVPRGSSPSPDPVEAPDPSSSVSPRHDRGSDVPRRIIDRIGGARVHSGRDAGRDGGSSGSSQAPRAESPRSESPRSEPRSSPPPSRGGDGGGRVKRDPD
ncbi:MAG TPA: DUF6600 domain-containing protein [Thermoanaerobaculia bacterium]|nr:DUF6600 domain-containing protein [Thermoanaerobaculia bacterium]